MKTFSYTILSGNSIIPGRHCCIDVINIRSLNFRTKLVRAFLYVAIVNCVLEGPFCMPDGAKYQQKNRYRWYMMVPDSEIISEGDSRHRDRGACRTCRHNSRIRPLADICIATCFRSLLQNRERGRDACVVLCCVVPILNSLL